MCSSRVIGAVFWRIFLRLLGLSGQAAWQDKSAPLGIVATEESQPAFVERDAEPGL
jgi:hypothetical protein